MNKVVKRIGALIVAAAVMLTTVPVETLASNKEGKEPYKVVATEATKMKLSAAKKAELDAFIADSFLADCGLDTNEVYVINDRSDFYIDYANSEFKDNGQMAISRVYGVNMQLQELNMSEVLCLSADGSVVANSERFSIGYNFTGAADFAWNLFDEACMEPLFPYSEYYPVYEGLSQQLRKNEYNTPLTICGRRIFVQLVYTSFGSSTSARYLPSLHIHRIIFFIDQIGHLHKLISFSFQRGDERIQRWRCVLGSIVT